MLLQMIVASVLGGLLGFTLGRLNGYHAGFLYAESIYDRARHQREPIHHHSAYGESFDYVPSEYVPVFSQDAETSLFPILPDVTETTEIPVTDFDSALIRNRKGY